MPRASPGSLFACCLHRGIASSVLFTLLTSFSKGLFKKAVLHAERNLSFSFLFQPILLIGRKFVIWAPVWSRTLGAEDLPHFPAGAARHQIQPSSSAWCGAERPSRHNPGAPHRVGCSRIPHCPPACWALQDCMQMRASPGFYSSKHRAASNYPRKERAPQLSHTNDNPVKWHEERATVNNFVIFSTKTYFSLLGVEIPIQIPILPPPPFFF